MGSKVIRNITKVFKSASGVLFGRTTSGTGRGEELSPSTARTLLSVYSTSQVDTALTAKADLVGGVVPSAQIPAVAITEYLGSVANQAAMLALTGDRGDWCLRSDTGTTWVLSDDDSTLLSSWIELNYPTAPVTSVNGETGAVTLSASDVGAAATSHSHAQSDITNLTTDLAGKAAASITITAGTGLSGGGDLSTNRTIDLENTAVTPGSYTATNLTVDAQGRITAAANGSGGNAAGSSGQVQYNASGSFAGAAALVYATSGTNLTVTATGSTVKPLIAKGAASQSVSIFEAQNSSGTAFLTVSSIGVLTVASATGANPAIKINDPDVTVPSYSATGFDPTLDSGTICLAGPFSGTTGGINVNGFTSATNTGTPLRFTGHHGGTSPTTAAISFAAFKHNGTTNRSALTGSEIVAEFYAGSTLCLGVQANGLIKQPTTITTAGTTGNRTINNPTGTVNIAAAGTTVTVTNSLVTANSIVFAVIRTNDATARITSVVPASGSFVINIVAATGEVSIGFFVLN